MVGGAPRSRHALCMILRLPMTCAMSSSLRGGAAHGDDDGEEEERRAATASLKPESTAVVAAVAVPSPFSEAPSPVVVVTVDIGAPWIFFVAFASFGILLSCVSPAKSE
ncbi:unnamed protein product [Ectocarpus sp. 13 AM-2016]